MKTTVERVREICKEKGIPVSKMEQDLGFGNGFLNPKKAKDIKGERVIAIAEYLDVSIAEILGTNQTEKEPVTSDGDELSDAEVRVIELLRQIPADRQDEAYSAIESVLRLMLR